MLIKDIMGWLSQNCDFVTPTAFKSTRGGYKISPHKIKG